FQTANKNRGARPWVFAYLHRPFYCSNQNSEECTDFENKLIVTFIKIYFFNIIRQLSFKGVDITFMGHEHSYERFLPRSPKSKEVFVAYPYKNPAGPIYIISGAAVCAQ
ncbi:hypothetical protein PMAYCL1PPCAC_08022, partial [Pristionchus mayeri]